MTKTRSALDRFRLYFEKLPGDEVMEKRVQDRRRRENAKRKAEHRQFMDRLTIPITKAIVARINQVQRRVKR